MKRLTAAILVFSAMCLSAQAQTTLKEYIGTLGSQDPMRGTSFGLLVMNFKGDTLASVNPDKRMIPASNVKVITTGAALRQLGPDFRFKTSLAYSGTIEDGVLDGNLYIIGGGDPTTASKYDCATPMDSLFSRWRGILAEAGITSIRGTVVGDGRESGRGEVCRDWCSEDLGFYYGAVPGLLNFYENAQDFNVTPADSIGRSVTVTPFFPDAPWMIFNHSCTTSSQGDGDKLVYSSSQYAPFGEMSGSYAIDRSPRIEECVNRFPEYTVAYYFHNYLVSNGFEVSDAFGDVNRFGRIGQDMLLYDDGEEAAPRESLTMLGSTDSPRLIEIISETLERSDNFYAEAILKALGREMTGCASFDSSLVAESRVLDKLGMSTAKNVQLRDGSGLARTNYVSPAFFVKFLTRMAHTSSYKTYLRAFPQPGRGTLAARLAKADPSVKTRIRMKSGSMNGVRCYCGYILPSDGTEENTIAFSLMINNATATSSSLNPIIDRIISLAAARN